MAETTMPTAEAEVMVDAEERGHYELAFHILPTVVEGEVPDVFDAVKTAITEAGGEITDEEAPQRFELAYEIEKYVEGKHRKFASAYFGWVRFTAAPSATDPITQAIEVRTDILRHLLIRLTREEAAHPFRFHEALDSQKQVTTVEEEDVVAPAATPETSESETTDEEKNVDGENLDEALKRDEA